MIKIERSYPAPESLKLKKVIERKTWLKDLKKIFLKNVIFAV